MQLLMWGTSCSILSLYHQLDIQENKHVQTRKQRTIVGTWKTNEWAYSLTQFCPNTPLFSLFQSLTIKTPTTNQIISSLVSFNHCFFAKTLANDQTIFYLLSFNQRLQRRQHNIYTFLLFTLFQSLTIKTPLIDNKIPKELKD